MRHIVLVKTDDETVMMHNHGWVVNIGNRLTSVSTPVALVVANGTDGVVFQHWRFATLNRTQWAYDVEWNSLSFEERYLIIKEYLDLWWAFDDDVIPWNDDDDALILIALERL